MWPRESAAAEPIAIPKGWLAPNHLSACAGIAGAPHLWVATRPGEVLELHVAPSVGNAAGSRTWAVTAARILGTPGLPHIWDLAAARLADGTERLYAVVGREQVHQLVVDDLPVLRRLEPGPPPAAASP